MGLLLWEKKEWYKIVIWATRVLVILSIATNFYLLESQMATIGLVTNITMLLLSLVEFIYESYEVSQNGVFLFGEALKIAIFYRFGILFIRYYLVNGILFIVL